MFPSFSIVLETENLATANLQGLFRSIASLADQTPSPAQANEVLLIESGDTPPEILAQLQAQYDWLTVKPAPPGTEYYDSKMLGAQWSTGEIIVYYDSDCIYDRHWLQEILNSFANPDVAIVGGETTTNGVGFYGTAMALAYIFPQYSGRSQLMPANQYFLNNVAFQRSVLLEHPIPTGLPLYRGNCVLHARNLIAAGYTIWRQPKARSLHAPPNGLKHFIQRFLLIGHDLYWQKQLLKPIESHRSSEQSARSDDPSIEGRSKLAIGLDRISKMIERDRRHAFFLPFCLPVVFVAVFLISIGYQITCRRPHYLRQRMGNL